MNKPTISIICALAEKNRAIGKNNALLWQLPADLKHFKDITSGHPIVMGQKTYESIGRPLPNRTNIVITNDKSFKASGVRVCYSIADAIDFAKKIDEEEIFIIGGGSIYTQTIDLADRLYLTLLDGDFEADTYFPNYSSFDQIEKSDKQEDNGYSFYFTVFEKKELK
ncbi:MAG: dihydrofolate reductase [Candidatus Berkelbacteria bacterium]